MLYNAIVLAGPTGVGKTNLSIKLAKLLDAEIISVDSMQIYKKLDIGTSKITIEEMQGIKHHMLDIINPDEEFSVGDFEKKVNDILNSNENKFFILVGGTGLYIDAVTDGMSKLPNKDLKIREELENLSLKKLQEELKKIDICSYNNIDINNKVRLVRAIEVYKITNIKFSEIINNKIKKNNFTFLKVFLNRNREELYDIINQRVDFMLQKGLLEEAKSVYNEYDKVKAIGYKELFSYFENNISLEEAIKILKQKSRNYAKRQLTWFNSKKDYIRYNLSEITEEKIIKDILKRIGRE